MGALIDSIFQHCCLADSSGLRREELPLRGGDRNRRDGIVEATGFCVKSFFAHFDDFRY
jgi:hypothetical protein